MASFRRKAPRLLVLMLPLIALGCLASAAGAAVADHLIVSQFMVKSRAPYVTFGSPFIAITNPTASSIDLSHVYLTDATATPTTQYTNITRNNPATANPGGGAGADFHARFPAGYMLPAGATLAVALNGSGQYFEAYGRQPDFELFEESPLPDAVPELVAAFPGAIAAGLGGGTNVPALSDVSETIVLYHWDGVSDLVQDLDYVIWGTTTAVRVDKSGLTVGAGTYLNDRAVGSQITLGTAAGLGFGQAYRRVNTDEGTETPTGGNGFTGHNETSENLTTTWAAITGSTPPPAPPTAFPSAPIFIAASQDPAIPYAGLEAVLSATVRSNSALTNVSFLYNVDGGAFAPLPGTDGGSGVWTATVPAQAGGAVVTWYCTAANAAGGLAATPVAAPRYTKGWTVAGGPPQAVMRKSPYLVYLGDPTTMQVIWQTDLSRACTIEWGEDTNYSLGSAATTEYGADKQHTYTLAGLVPAHRYFYRVDLDGIWYTGSFRTAPPPMTQQIKFFAYGDTRTNVGIHNTIAGQMINAMAADPDFQSVIIATGDLVNSGNTEADWDNQFFSPLYPNIRRMMAELPYQSCMGNHEGTGALFTKYFPYPFVGGRYWSFDYGPAHFVVIDQYTNYAPGSAQLAWIEADLAATTQPWRFVLLHEPGWSAGGSHPNNTSVQQYLQPLFVQYGVSIVFCGHNHYYARAVVDGIQHLTIGGGGAPLYAPVPASPSVVVTNQSHHYTRITIDGGHLGFAAVNGTTVLDTFTLDRATAVDQSQIPSSMVLHAVIPNPFNPTTTIRFDLPTSGRAQLAVYDIAGRRVRVLVDNELPAGSHKSVWDGRDATGHNAPSGTYVARLESEGASKAVRMSLVR